MPRGVKGTRKPKKTFADIAAARARYNPEVEGFGDANEWRSAFNDRMGFDEAQKVLYGNESTPRQILGVSKGCTWRDVVSAFRKRSMETHPDRCIVNKMNKAQAEEAFKKVSAAYTMLAKEFGQ
jgi:DnaJ-class molecular chaperone